LKRDKKWRNIKEELEEGGCKKNSKRRVRWNRKKRKRKQEASEGEGKDNGQ
jgi:hypothetical protein